MREDSAVKQDDFLALEKMKYDLIGPKVHISFLDSSSSTQCNLDQVLCGHAGPARELLWVIERPASLVSRDSASRGGASPGEEDGL